MGLGRTGWRQRLLVVGLWIRLLEARVTRFVSGAFAVRGHRLRWPHYLSCFRRSVCSWCLSTCVSSLEMVFQLSLHWSLYSHLQSM